jgi:hypothetical protein
MTGDGDIHTVMRLQAAQFTVASTPQAGTGGLPRRSTAGLGQARQVLFNDVGLTYARPAIVDRMTRQHRPHHFTGTHKSPVDWRRGEPTR